MIAVPIVSDSIKKALADIKKAERVADIIEVRLDYIRDINKINLTKLLAASKQKIIITDRKNRLDLINESVRLGADFIDLDISIGSKLIREVTKQSKAKLIVSFHNFKETNRKELTAKYKEIKKLRPGIIKIVSFANSINDNLVIFDLINQAKKDKVDIIAICMGEKGEISRILAPIYGSFLTFGSLESGKESAPGQIPAEILRQVYRVDKLKNPKIFGLVGNPVSHSRGIYFHNEQFKKVNKNSIYLNFLVDDPKAFIKGFKPIISGLSITIPFKTEIIPHLDKLDPAAKEIGAVNTVVKQKDKLVGYNTDMLGAIDAIKSKTSIAGKKILMIGAGGVARAVGYGIVKEKGDLMITNRTEEKALELARQLNCSSTKLDNSHQLGKFDIIINCTSIGMFPKITQTPIPKPLLNLLSKKAAVVFDTVYTPKLTKLLKDAGKLGISVVGGNDMFIAQALEQQKLFQKVK
ncbi:MAG TPA: shikimate dehydrogenase [Candidatus Nanoarchaeia archaeon]|nr:shikimate dehydrogenase [Candidatus Nanoarchaeia archaeon]